jgi:RHS repeat-associated protein
MSTFGSFFASVRPLPRAARLPHRERVRWLAALLALVLVTTLLDSSVAPKPAFAGDCGVVGYNYDAAGRLVGVHDQTGQTARYTYDAVGNTTGVENLGTTALSVATFTPAAGPVGTVQEQGTPTATRLTSETGQTLQRTDGDGARVPITDLLGSTVGLVDPATGTLTTGYSYDPFGNPTSTGSPSGNPQQFTGRDFDSQTGLLYNRSRYYSPSLGRFISGDPAGLLGGATNPYLYALADPVNLSDPNGDCPICAAVAVGCVVGGVIGVATGWGLSSLFGRKYSWGDGFRDFGIGCVLGALTDGLGAALRGGAAAEELTGTALARQLGRQGEAAAGIVKNTERIASASGTAKYRIPDYLSHAAKEIGEVKNVAGQSLTNQLLDDIAYAQANGYKMILWVRPTTTLTGPLQAAINKGLIILRYLP